MGEVFRNLDNLQVMNTVNRHENDIQGLNASLETIANKGTTVEVLERVTKEEIDRQISDGTIANLTIEDFTINENKVYENYVKYEEVELNGNAFELKDVKNNTKIKILSNSETYINDGNYLPFKIIEPYNGHLKDIVIDKNNNTFKATCLTNSNFVNFELEGIFLKAGTYNLSYLFDVVDGLSTDSTGIVYVNTKKDINEQLLNLATIYKNGHFTITEDCYVHLSFYFTVVHSFSNETTIIFKEFMLDKDGSPYKKYKGNILYDGVFYSSSNGVNIYNKDNSNFTIRYVSNIQENETFNIVCWGDSLTESVGCWNKKPPSDTNSDVSYPKVLERLINKHSISVINGGVGGDTSWMLASRQGAMPLKVQPFTLPSEKIPTRIFLKGIESNAFYDGVWNYYENNLTYNIAPENPNSQINPCYINGIKGMLSRILLSQGTPDPETGETVQSNEYAYYFTRDAVGNTVEIKTEKNLITYADNNLKGSVCVFWIGQNDAPNHEGRWITQVGVEERIKNMIENNSSNKYIVLDAPSGNDVLSIGRNQSFALNFGKRYINIRDYICKYGILIANELGANIILNNDDISKINDGEIPMCFKIDGVHGNYWYYQIVARAVHEKGEELGYW